MVWLSLITVLKYAQLFCLQQLADSVHLNNMSGFTLDKNIEHSLCFQQKLIGGIEGECVTVSFKMLNLANSDRNYVPTVTNYLLILIIFLRYSWISLSWICSVCEDSQHYIGVLKSVRQKIRQNCRNFGKTINRFGVIA